MSLLEQKTINKGWVDQALLKSEKFETRDTIRSIKSTQSSTMQYMASKQTIKCHISITSFCGKTI